MGLFDKKYCAICNEKIGFLGNRKLEDADMCKNCAALVSPFMTDRRRTTLAEMNEHLAYREANRQQVAAFNATRTLGIGRTKVLLDEDAGKFIVTSSTRWRDENPDVMTFSQVTGCQSEIREERTELKRKDSTGKEISFNPPRYDIDYDFYISIHINSPWYQEINFKTNDSRIDQRTSVEYREAERQSEEIKTALTQLRQTVRENIAASNAPKMAQTCPWCGATTTPTASGCCEFCNGAIAQ